jgi:hypothetical protein
MACLYGGLLSLASWASKEGGRCCHVNTYAYSAAELRALHFCMASRAMCDHDRMGLRTSQAQQELRDHATSDHCERALPHGSLLCERLQGCEVYQIML